MCSSAFFCSLLRSAGEARSASSGRSIHHVLVRDGGISIPRILAPLLHMYALCGLPSDARASLPRSDAAPMPRLWLLNALLRAFGSNGLLEDAMAVFSEIPCKDVVSWTTAISSLSRHGSDAEALRMYHQMLVEGAMPNVVCFVSVLRACGRMRALVEGTRIHVSAMGSDADHHAEKQNAMLVAALVKMYGEWGELSLAWSIFSRSQGLDIVAWNTMIQVFVENRDLPNAMEAFAMAPDRDAATWNTMLGGLAQDGHGDMAFELFRRMNLEGVVEPNVVTLVCVLNAFTSAAFLERGRLVHMHIVDLGLEKGIEIGNALISAYGRCRDAEDAKSMFERMHRRDVVSWTAIVGACCEMGRFKEALGILKKMRLDRVPPDKVSFLCALFACASLSALDEGKEMDGTVCKLGMETHPMIQTALIDMYGKCGSIEDAMEVFDRSPERTIEMWNAVLTMLSQRGFLDEVRVSLMQMQQQNIMPNHVTLSCILAACSHSGSVEDASRAFLAIDMLHGIRHTEDHYLCIVDLFARTGELEKAQEMIENFPFQSDECLAWQCLLSGCRIHNDVERAVHVAMHCVCVDPSEASMQAWQAYH